MMYYLKTRHEGCACTDCFIMETRPQRKCHKTHLVEFKFISRQFSAFCAAKMSGTLHNKRAICHKKH